MPPAAERGHAVESTEVAESTETFCIASGDRAMAHYESTEMAESTMFIKASGGLVKVG